ncbi:MAG: YdcF family protein [Colwellia sp.]|nr:YdcF family protein [Colwellia sp.]
MDLFVLKKIISILIMPINLVLILLILAIVFFNKRPKVSFKYLLSAVLLLVLSSMPIISNTLMVSIEDNYQAFTRSSIPVDYIVVLGNGHASNDALPVTSQLKVASLQRLVETLRIYKIHPEARIITSGFAGDDPVSNAEKMKQSLVLLGIAEQKIITENFPKDTEEEAQLISPRVQGTNVVLITNAEHMPRSMKYFQLQGIFPIAAPTGYWVKSQHNKNSWTDYVPSSNKLEQTTVVWYESLGRLVQWFKTLFS